MMRAVLLLWLIGQMAPVFSQNYAEKYWIGFRDKHHSPFSISQPLDYLSQRAIDRRHRMGIPVTVQDYPVNPDYLDSLEFAGAIVHGTSRWLNGATIYAFDTTVVSKIKKMAFVKTVQKSNPHAVRVVNEDLFAVLPIQRNPSRLVQNKPIVRKRRGEGCRYGYATTQISMIKGDFLHQIGFSGNGMLIGVLDAGYSHADVLPAFDALWMGRQIVGYKDFVDVNTNLFLGGSHGMMVLSIMGGDIPDSLVGTAPEASYLLLRTEDASSENITEEDNWVAAIEYADSAGVDVINSSLGYTRFDDTTAARTYDDLTGLQSRASLAATMAIRKGMIVCNSAGNSALQPWHHIGVPADADGILTVGAVNACREYAPFSSVGPTADGRVKPDVSTLGSGTFVQGTDGMVASGNGTSFSSPVLAGMVACLWQAFPDKSNLEIMDAVRRSASHYETPNMFIGYGVPDFYKAYHLLMKTQDWAKNDSMPALVVYPNPITDDQFLKISFPSSERAPWTLSIFDNVGAFVFSASVKQVVNGAIDVRLADMDQLPDGIYLLQVSSDKVLYSVKLVKKG